MTTQTRKRAKQPSSCPPGHVPAGHVVPLSLTVRQLAYCRRAVGISRFTYNLCVTTHQFCNANPLPWPSWQNLNIDPAMPCDGKALAAGPTSSETGPNDQGTVTPEPMAPATLTVSR